MKMLVQSVVSLAFLCSTPHFLSAQLVPRSANTWAYFSHIADGGGWQTTFTVSNPNRNPVSVEDLFPEILRVRIFTWTSKGMSPRAVSSSGFRRLALSSSRAVRPAPPFGWDGPRFSGIQFQSRAWRPTALWRTEALDIRSAFPLRSLRFTTSRRRRPTSGLPWATSIPLRCPSSSGPTSNNGSSFHGNMTLPAHGHRAKILSEVIPDLPRDFVGTVSIGAENIGYLVSALTLRSAGGVYSSLPSGEIARPDPHFNLCYGTCSLSSARLLLLRS